MQVWCGDVFQAGVNACKIMYGERNTRSQKRERQNDTDTHRETDRPEAENRGRLGVRLAMRLLKLRLFDAYLHHQLVRQVVRRNTSDVDVHHLQQKSDG